MTNAKFKLIREKLIPELTYIKLLQQRFPNGGISVIQLEVVDQIIPDSTLNWKDVLDSIFENTYFDHILKEAGISATNYEVIHKKNIREATDGFSLITELAKTLYYGGEYLSTLITLKKYNGPILSSFDAINLSRDFIANLITESIEELRVVSIYMTKWNDWFVNAPFSDSYFIFHPKKSSITLIMLTDTD